ncbi:MAG: EF-hand domain-containing protein [Ekhidna sp.]|nr:EF-hand domain-containing protein [Ekhidna sp.]
MVALEETVKKWVFFFYILDVNRNGILEHSDIELILKRAIETRKGLFDSLDERYLKFVALKNFDRLIMEAGKGKQRSITLLEWIRIIKQNNESKKKSFFIRWFSASAVRFMFDLCDHNRDGFIDFDEFELLYSIFGLNRSNIISAFKQLDENRDGRLSKSELYEAIGNFFSSSNATIGSHLFGKIDSMNEDYLNKILTV